MIIKAQLVQPGICETPFSEVEVEVEETDSEETMKLKAAHKLMENYDVYIKGPK
jgi:hypothetical protein